MKNLKGLGVTITKRYTTVDGALFDKNALPAELQVKVPFYMWGKFDRDGGYRQALTDTPPNPALKYFNTFLGGSNDFLAFTGANEIRPLVNAADVLLVFTDDLNAPNFFIWVIISAQSQPYASIMNNVDGSIELSHLFYNAPEPLNYEESLRILHLSKLGDRLADSFSPEQGNSPYDNTEVIKNLRLDIQFALTPYIGINSYILFESDVLTFNFMIDVPKYG